MSVHVIDEQLIDVDVEMLRVIAERVLAEQGYPGETEISVILISDDSMATYNERFMERTGPTDVLAFPLESMIPGAPPTPPDRHAPPVHLGDVVIAPAQVGRQAAEHASSVADELALMVVHGVLHLMGYDHVEDDEAEEMEARERAILAAAGVVRR